MDMTSLERRLLEFDGKNTSCLSEVQTACGDDAGYLDDLIRLCFDSRPLISAGATWILKAELQAGTALQDRHRDDITQGLSEISSWQAALHLLQVVELLDLTAVEVGAFSAWARQYADHPRPFLRAWSLHAGVVLGHRFSQPGSDVQALLAQADRDPAASVRARARQLRKLLQLPGG